MSGFEQFLTIRQKYAKILPEWEAEYHATGRMHHDPYVLDWVPMFTPIEEAVWSDIRSSGMPFYPQIPVLNYFIDFGCPMLKIGIECDGKAWHDSERDAVRDARLAEEGWNIFRIEGHECKRVLPAPWREYEEDADSDEIDEWLNTTSEGVMYAINATYFDKHLTDFARTHTGRIAYTLFEHNTTPCVQTHRPRELASSNAKLSSEYNEDFVAAVMRELQSMS